MGRLAALLATFAALGCAPLVLQSDVALNAGIAVLYAALLGQSWNLLAGFGGQFSFGHAAFFGTGAYAVAVLQVRYGLNPWVGLAGGVLAATAVAWVVGFATFRYGLRGSYFALVTLAFAEVLRILSNSVPFTGAGVGLLIPLEPGAANLQFTTKAGFYWLVWSMALGCFLVAWWFGHSRFGARLMAVRDNEDAARALGVDAYGTKLRAILLSGAFSGLAGTFYAQNYLYLDPNIAYGPAVSIESLLVPLVGGIGTLFGPLLGAAALHAVSEVSREVVGDVPGVSLAVYGALLVVMVLFLPRGIAGSFALLSRREAETVRAPG